MNTLLIFLLLLTSSSVYSFQSLDYDKKDSLLSEARNLGEIYRLISLNRLDGADFNRLLKEIDKNKSSYFEKFYTELNIYREIILSSQLEKISEKCSQTTKLTYLKKFTDQLCLNKVFKIINWNKKEDIKYFISFFDKEIPGYFEPTLKKLLFSSKKNLPIIKDQIQQAYDRKKIPFFPIEVLGSISTSKKNIQINNQWGQVEFIKGQLDELKTKCKASEEATQELIKLKESLKSIKNSNVSVQEEVMQDLAIFLKYTQGRKCLLFSQYVLDSITNDKNYETYDDLYFRYIWQSYLKKDFLAGLNFIQKYFKVEDFHLYSSKSIFWTSIIYFLNKEKVKGEELLVKIIEDNPLDFYSLQSSKILKKLNKKKYKNYHFDQFKTDNRYTNLNKHLPNEEIKKKIELIYLWAASNSTKLLEQEVASIDFKNVNSYFKQNSPNASELKNSLILQIAQILTETNRDLDAFKWIHKAIEHFEYTPSNLTLEVMFPVKFKDLIWKYSQEQGLDPYFTLGLIRQESAFNPLAKSIVGARGLMQIMPATGRILQRGVKPQQLNDPETGIKLGTKYLGLLKKKFEGNFVFVMAAYNAGDHRVKQWEKEIFLGERHFLSTAENIPFQETNNYVKLIYRNIYFYKMMLEKKEDSASLSTIYDFDLGLQNESTILNLF